MLDWRIVVPLLLFFAAQTGALIWWAASLTTTVKNHGKVLERLEEAFLQQVKVNTRLDILEGARADHEGRIRVIERGR